MSNEDDFDSLLQQLRAAEAAGEPAERLADLRRRITAAADAEARARDDARQAAELAARGPGFLTGTGRPERRVSLMAGPTGDLPFEDEGHETLGGMLDAFEEAKSRRDRAALGRLPLGASRFGGLPDLPPAIAWPTYQGRRLPFLAQLNLADLPPSSAIGTAPLRGWLYAFGLFDNDKAHRPSPVTVLRHRGPLVELARAARPEAAEVWPDWTGAGVYAVVPLTPRVDDAADPDAAADLADDSAGWLFGEVDEFWGTAGSLAYDAWQSGDDWINLLAMKSVGSMQWSDCGHLYLLIRRADLVAGDFMRVVGCVCST